VTTGLLGCGHKFCYGCIINWSKVCNACPLCKLPFTKIIQQKYGENIDYAIIKGYSANAIVAPIENSKKHLSKKLKKNPYTKYPKFQNPYRKYPKSQNTKIPIENFIFPKIPIQIFFFKFLKIF